MDWFNFFMYLTLKYSNSDNKFTIDTTELIHNMANGIVNILIDGYTQDIKFREMAKLYPTYNEELFYYLNRMYKDA